MSAEAQQRYTAFAIVLHWAIAIAILLMIPLGWWMGDRIEEGVVTDGVFQAYQFHKSIGLTVLALSLVRLGWRLANPPPPLPPHMPAWERIIAKATHWAFYFLMIALPLTGWLFVSAGWSVHENEPLVVATHWFGLIRVPELFGLPHTAESVRAGVAEVSMNVHSKLAWGVIVLAALHVGAALKHHVFDRDEVLTHMVPGLNPPFQTEAPPKNPVRLAILGGGLSLIVIALIAGLFAFAGMAADTGANAAQQNSTIAIGEPTPGAVPAAPEAPAAATPALPNAWRVDARTSSVGFAFVYTDDINGAQNFTGRFTNWRADIVFDPADLPGSSANVTIETASATDGVAMHDRALPGSQWFDAAAHPNATYRTTSIRHLGGDAYRAEGELTIRGRTRAVALPFTLTIDGDRASMNARTSIDRRDFDIGKGSDADDSISRDIDIIIRVEAYRAS
ncbi:MAG: YceI family protein [Hyphomonadaceae bacterium JAD_PAG50586_4]|nr:MAG: YceI family protein [Hyphomonadaceae bacterium JAD_PAG50586_4]